MFDETLYEGMWYTIERSNAQDLAYEIYIPAEWSVKEASFSERPSTEFVMPQEFAHSSFQYANFMSPAELSAAGEAETLASLEEDMEKTRINDLGADVYYTGTEYSDPDNFGTGVYTEILVIHDEGGLFVLASNCSTQDGSSVEEEAEAFEAIAKNIFHSLRLAQQDEEQTAE